MIDLGYQLYMHLERITRYYRWFNYYRYDFIRLVRDNSTTLHRILVDYILTRFPDLPFQPISRLCARTFPHDSSLATGRPPQILCRQAGNSCRTKMSLWLQVVILADSAAYHWWSVVFHLTTTMILYENCCTRTKINMVCIMI